MFKKYAKVTSIASASYDDISPSGFKRVAFNDHSSDYWTESRGEAEVAPYHKSFYVDGSRKIDVKAFLEKHADKYNISKNPKDYLFEAIRANTVNVPNENHDAFSKSELLRFDPVKRTAVYMTYEGKGHFLDHVTSKPQAARGIIVDATYNDLAAPLANCPSCNFETREASNRDASGIHCKKCGSVVKDEFVEILVAVDTQKDPKLADGIKTGHFRAGSMGCSCQSTTCNVCSHVAYSVNEFCEHVRKGNKGTFWVREASPGRENWRRVEARSLEQEFKKRGRKFVKDDFCYAVIESDANTSPARPGSANPWTRNAAPKSSTFEVRKAFESCNQVEFDEYSRVHTPADPKALQIEILKAASKEDENFDSDALALETEAFILKAQLTEIENRLKRVAGKGMDQEADLDMEADFDPEAAIHIRTPEGDHFEAPDGSTVAVAPEGHEPPGMRTTPLNAPGDGMPGQQPGQPEMPGQPGQAPEGIEEVTQQVTGPQQNDNEQWTPESMGVLPPASGSLQRHSHKDRRSKRKLSMANETTGSLFAADYGDFYAEVTQEGNALLVSPAGPVMVLTAGKRLDSEEERTDFGREVLASVIAEGLVDTFQKFDGSFNPRFAQILDAAVNDLADHKTRPEEPSIHDQMDDLEPADARVKVTGLPKPITEGSVSEANAVRPKSPDSSIQDDMQDHDDHRKTTYDQLSTIHEMTDDMKGDVRRKKDMTDPVTEEGEPAMADSHKPGTGKKSASLEEATRNVRLAAKAQIARIEKEAAAQVEAAEKAALEKATQKFARALRVASRRFALDLEDSPLKLAVFQVLGNKQVVGHDSGSGEDLTIGPLSQELAVTLCQRAWTKGASAETEELIKRATELMSVSDEYLRDAEKDLSKQAIKEPIISKSASLYVDEDEDRAEEMRREASQGNLHLAPAPEVEAEVFDKRAAIEEALSFRDNQVNKDLARYDELNQRRLLPS
jgi:hypothetical protein